MTRQTLSETRLLQTLQCAGLTPDKGGMFTISKNMGLKSGDIEALELLCERWDYDWRKEGDGD